MAIDVKEFLKAAAKHWNKIKENASVKEIDRLVATLTEASYECTEEIEVFIFNGFVSVLLPQIEELKQKLSLQNLSTVQTEDNDFVEAEFLGFVTNFSPIQPVGNDEDDSEEDSQADIQTILLPVAAVVEDEDEDVPVSYLTCWIDSFEPVQDSDIDDTEPEDFNV
jgi:hypothetical protein